MWKGWIFTMRILHSADWHLNSPIQGRSPEQTQLLKTALLSLPEKITAAARAQGCDLMLLSGDLFDGPCTLQDMQALARTLEEAELPVVIAVGNHDHAAPWAETLWPENVHIFRRPVMECITIPALDCRIYGAGYAAPHCPGLLQGFRAEGSERYCIGILHGDPTQPGSPYCPVTAGQVTDSGLDYLAMGHIHKGGAFRAGSTLCAWPGSPMGRGYDETGAKGVLIVELEQTCSARFLMLDTPAFYDLEVSPGENAAAAIAAALPGTESRDFYRITLTGESQSLTLSSLHFPGYPNLELRDRTVPPIDLWAGAGDDSLSGIYFRLLQEAMEGQDETLCRRIRLAARISRQLLDGQEVTLP